MQKLLTEIIGGWVRAALLIISAWLVQRHIVTAEQGESLVAMLFSQFLNSLPGLLALTWQWWQKHTARVKLLTALTMPVGVTENQVIAKIKSGATTPTVKTPPDTVPGVPSGEV